MNYNINELHNAIYKRKSRRKYISKEVEESKLMELKSFIITLSKEMETTRAELINMNSKEVFGGIIGSYGAITGAKQFLVFLGNVDDDNIYKKIGYFGEAVILKATSLNLGTCWVGGKFENELIENAINLKENEKIIAISPLGYTESQFSFREKIIKKAISSDNRKELDDICVNGFDENWNQEIKEAIKCARLAPSAVNRQPWKFSVDGNIIKVFIELFSKDLNIPKELDCGIALLHLEIGAKRYNNEVELIIFDEPNIGQVRINKVSD